MELTTETFRPEIDNAMLSYDRHVVCVFKTPDECLEAIERLMIKAIKAFENRAEGMRHGIALDKEITIMLSQSSNPEEEPTLAVQLGAVAGDSSGGGPLESSPLTLLPEVPELSSPSLSAGPLMKAC